MFSNGNNGEFSAVKQQELEAVNGGLSLGDFGGAVSLPGIGGGRDLVSGGLVVVQPGLSWENSGPDPFKCGCKTGAKCPWFYPRPKAVPNISALQAFAVLE